MEHTDLHFVRGILHNETPVLEELYRKFLPVLFGMLRRHGATYEDSRDVFQEAIVVVFNQAARDGFQLTAPFGSYLLGIGRYIWLRQLKKNARTEVTSAPLEGFDVDADIEQQIFESEKRNLYREKFAQLGPDCRQLLQRFFDRESLASIARDMGYTDDYIKKKNKVCKQKLLESIQQDPRFREFVTHTQATPTEPTDYDK